MSEVIRRFEVHAATLADLNPARTVVQEAARPGLLTILDLEEVERPPSLEIRLRGKLGAVASVVEDIRHRNYQVLQDFVDVPTDAVSDRTFPDPWALLRMSVEPRKPDPAGPVGFPGGASRTVKVAIVDSGIMVDHVDLKQHVQPRAVGGTRSTPTRYVGGTAVDDATDEDGHGTTLAGTILATASFSKAIRLIPVKFFDASTSPSAENAWQAIDFALTQDPDIILLSWELGSDSVEVRNAIQRACKAGILVVFAAGNHGSNNDEVPAYPSRYAEECRERTITVMATDQYDAKAWFSSYGSTSVDLAAPGVEIISTRPYVSKAAESPEGQALRYGRYHGTSAASAHVAGAAALLMSRYPGLKAEEVKTLLTKSVEKRPDLKCRSEGRLDLGKALADAAKVAPSVPSVSSGGP